MNISFVLLHLSTFIVILMAFSILKIQIKSQLKYVFFSIVLLLILWNLGTLAEEYFRIFFGYTEMIFVNTTYISICFIPVCILFLGMVYARTQISYQWRYALLLIIPVASSLLVWSNSLHKLFFIHYSINSREATYGNFFFIHSVYSYLCIMIGISYLIVFSVKNSGFFSKQSLLLVTGISVPVAVNILFTFNLADLPFMSNSIAFTFSALCMMIAIFKFDFLNMTPIALQTVVDRISDSFMVLDKSHRVIHYNKSMVNTFGNITAIKRKNNFLDMLKYFPSIDAEVCREILENAVVTRKSVSFDRHITDRNFDRYFTVEISPIISNENHLGSIILLKDITEHKRDMVTIQEQQEKLVEQDRMGSLGTLMGGISHNMKTPIMAMSGCIIALEDLIGEFRESLGNPIVTEEDYHEIGEEMGMHLRQLKGHLSYISNALTAIKNQVINPDSRSNVSFTLEEVLINIDFLMKYEIKNNACILTPSINADKNCMMRGDIGTLVQIINNLISNAIQSYDRAAASHSVDVSRRVIELCADETNHHIIFKVKDYGRGITESTREKLFKEMVTTKGKEGSGIGLYLSHTKVKVSFNGDMWFESQEGKGSTFYVKIPRLSA